MYFNVILPKHVLFSAVSISRKDPEDIIKFELYVNILSVSFEGLFNS